MSLLPKKLQAIPTTSNKQANDMDLISFDSWEFSAHSAQTQKTTPEECSLSTAPSMDDASMLDHPTSSHQNLTPRSNHIHVSVSGVIFLLHPSTFTQMETLPWTWDPLTGMHGLTTAPVLFELLLNFILFGSLPVLCELGKSDIEELEPLALLLGLDELHKHIERRSFVRAGSFGRRRRSSLEKQQQQQHMSSSSLTMTESSKGSNNDNNSNPPKMIIKKIQTVLQQHRRFNNPKEPRKMTHAEFCEMTDRMQ